MDLDRNGQFSDSESIGSDCSSIDEDKIHVGSEYQASVPINVLDESFCYLELDKSDPIWLPSKVKFSQAELDKFLKEASSFNICEEQALSLLHNCCYDLNKVRQTLPQTTRYVDTLDKWSHEEREHFINAYNYHGKKFKMIQASFPNKTMSDLVDYYYTWKKTRNSVSLITQYCNVLALQHNNTSIEDFTEGSSSPIALSSIRSPARDDNPHSIQSSQTSTIDNTKSLSSQTGTLANNVESLSCQSSTIVNTIESASSQIPPEVINSVESTLLSQDLNMVDTTDLNFASSTSTLPSSTATHSASSCRTSPTVHSPHLTSSNSAVNVSNPSDSNQGVSVLNANGVKRATRVDSSVLTLKDLVPEHLKYLLECLEEEPEPTEDVKPHVGDDTCRQSSSTQLGSSMFARCTTCKNILDTWSFSPAQGVVCYSCEPGAGVQPKEEVESVVGVETRRGAANTGENDLTALNRLNEVCKQTCDEEEVADEDIRNDADSQTWVQGESKDLLAEAADKLVESSRNPAPSTIEATTKLHKLKLVPRGLYFNVVDFIEIATNKAEYVDDVFKRMDREVCNLVKEVRSNNIRMDATLDNIESELPLDKYQSSNNNNNNARDKTDEEKLSVLWSDTEIFLVLQGFLKYGTDFETIAEILETKTHKQVLYFYQANRSYYDLNLLIKEHNRNKKDAENNSIIMDTSEVIE